MRGIQWIEGILRRWFRPLLLPHHLRQGQRGEQAACRHLQRQGMKILARNFRSRRGEIDIILRDGDCLVFAEVKTRASHAWFRPGTAVNARKRRRIARSAIDYIRRLHRPALAFRFDIVEVLIEEDRVVSVRHISNAFPLPPPLRYA